MLLAALALPVLLALSGCGGDSDDAPATDGDGTGVDSEGTAATDGDSTGVDSPGTAATDGDSTGDSEGTAATDGDSTGDSTQAPPIVVATTSIWGDVVANLTDCVAGVQVEVLMPPGTDPHAFVPSLADRATLEDATLVVGNGLGLEEGLVDTLEAVANSGVPVFFMTDHIEPLELDHGDEDHGDEDHGDEDHGDEDHGDEDHGDDDHGDDDHGDDDEGHHHHEGDPHVWFDPQRVSLALPALADELVKNFKEHSVPEADAVESCLQEYQAELLKVDTEIVEILSVIPDERRKLITNHAAYAFFANRYGLEELGSVISSGSTLESATPENLAKLEQDILDKGVDAIFAETQHAGTEIEALAARMQGVELYTLYTGTLGPPDSGADSYIGLLRTNAQIIARALGE